MSFAADPVEAESPSSALVSWRLIGIVCALFVVPQIVWGIQEHLFHLEFGDVLRAIISDPKGLSVMQREGNDRLNYAALESLSSLAIALFLAWSSATSLFGLGIVPIRIVRDLGIAAAIFILDRIVTAIYFLVSHSTSVPDDLHRFLQQLSIQPPVNSALMASTTIMFSTWQEVIFRGLLIPALREVSGSATTALLVSTLLSVSIHTDEGFYAMPRYLIFGLLAGGIFLKTGSVWPAIIGNSVVTIWATL